MIELTMLVGVFLFGVMAGFLLVLSVAAAKEGRRLRARPPTRVAAAARRVVGLRIQVPATPAGREDDRR